MFTETKYTVKIIFIQEVYNFKSQQYNFFGKSFCQMEKHWFSKEGASFCENNEDWCMQYINDRLKVIILVVMRCGLAY